MSGGGKGSEPTGSQTITSTNKSEPWGPSQPYLQNIFGNAAQLYGKGGPEFYPGATTAPFSPQQEMAMNMTAGRALSGSPLNDVAQQQNMLTTSGAYLNGPAQHYLGNTASGGMLNSNPHVDAMFQQASDPVMSGINATFGSGGRTGSNAHAAGLTEGMGNLATQIYGGNYAQERQNQLAASGQIQNAFSGERNNMLAGMGMAPGLANTDYADFDRLMGVGNQVQGQAQNQLGGLMDRWNFNQSGPGSPEASLQNYANILMPGAGLGSTSNGSQTQPLYGGSAGMNALGGGMAGMGMLRLLRDSGDSGALGPWGYALPAAGAVMGGMK